MSNEQLLSELLAHLSDRKISNKCPKHFKDICGAYPKQNKKIPYLKLVCRNCPEYKTIWNELIDYPQDLVKHLGTQLTRIQKAPVPQSPVNKP